ncbi:repeat protein [Moumouvirus goulette]|uniref:Repeat protein n=1 Tax=Moumouvirus goulette TaxID=1247379 RepID=M1PME5_9VIRU|nr:repeat protein [Moumouvirus goulette]AGF85121.1 repeat protein [Moumouvirus goulette]
MVNASIYSDNYSDDSNVTDILNWWLNSGLELKYSETIIKKKCNKIDILNWWINSGLFCK